MNGCCMGSADGPWHDKDCYWYWPCGCKKIRDKPGGRPKPHTHKYK